MVTAHSVLGCIGPTRPRVVGEGDPRRTGRSDVSAQALARGVLHVHSAPPALCPHIEWAVAGVLGMPISLTWTPQPALTSALRAECSWRAAPGTAGRIASAMRDWSHVRFEVTEEPSPGYDGERYAYTP